MVVPNGTILYAGPYSDAPTDVEIIGQYAVDTLMPGLWDVHTHFEGTDCDALTSSDAFHSDNGGYFPAKYDSFACALAQLKETVCAGITSVRELGGMYGQSLKHVTEAGLVPAPHFYHAARPIGITGGHTDQQYMPVDITRNDVS